VIHWIQDNNSKQWSSQQQTMCNLLLPNLTFLIEEENLACTKNKCKLTTWDNAKTELKNHLFFYCVLLGNHPNRESLFSDGFHLMLTMQYRRTQIWRWPQFADIFLENWWLPQSWCKMEARYDFHKAIQ
jgi:hypothetical protein